MKTGTQLGSCHSSSRQPWRQHDGVDKKNANLRFGEAELKRELGSDKSGGSRRLKNRSDEGER